MRFFPCSLENIWQSPFSSRPERIFSLFFFPPPLKSVASARRVLPDPPHSPQQRMEDFLRRSHFLFSFQRRPPFFSLKAPNRFCSFPQLIKAFFFEQTAVSSLSYDSPLSFSFVVRDYHDDLSLPLFFSSDPLLQSPSFFISLSARKRWIRFFSPFFLHKPEVAGFF